MNDKIKVKQMLDIIRMYDSNSLGQSEILKIPEEIFTVMSKVPRHVFVPNEQKEFAYQDTPLPIGYGQTISQPYIVALMTALLKPKSHAKILEVGTGSGYQAAILSQIVSEVYSVEIIEELYQSAKMKYKDLGYNNIYIKCCDGHDGWDEHAPYDGIIVTAAAENIPQLLIQQLKPGGRMVIPVGGTFEIQQLLIIHKDKKGTIIKDNTIDVRFVPLTKK